MTPAAEHLTLADLAAPTIAAEVESDDIPGLLGEMERLRATLWARPAQRRLVAAVEVTVADVLSGTGFDSRWYPLRRRGWMATAT